MIRIGTHFGMRPARECNFGVDLLAVEFVRRRRQHFVHRARIRERHEAEPSAATATTATTTTTTTKKQLETERKQIPFIRRPPEARGAGGNVAFHCFSFCVCVCVGGCVLLDFSSNLLARNLLKRTDIGFRSASFFFFCTQKEPTVFSAFVKENVLEKDVFLTRRPRQMAQKKITKKTSCFIMNNPLRKKNGKNLMVTMKAEEGNKKKKETTEKGNGRGKR